MAKSSRVIELRTAEGKLIVSLHLIEREIEDNRREEPPGNRNQESRGERSPGGNGRGEELMTDAQKRYLFRLLADKGKEGSQAYDYLRSQLGVGTLREVSKSEASQMIERLLGEAKGGEYDGPPF